MLSLWNFNTNTFFFQQGRENLALYFFSIIYFLLFLLSQLSILHLSIFFFLIFQSPKRFCHVVNTSFSVKSRCWLPLACSGSSKWNIMMFHNLRVEGRRTDNWQITIFLSVKLVLYYWEFVRVLSTLSCLKSSPYSHKALGQYIAYW